MSFDKYIPAKIAEYKIFDVDSTEELQKQASDLDLPDDFVYDPDFLYLWIRIVSAGEYYGPNKNGDFFPEDQLVEYYESFNEAHPFKNHENKLVEKAIGKIITQRWNPVMKCVELLKGIDKKKAPEVARGYLKGYLTDVSMGCKVPYTICSICGNKARKKSEFCTHVRYHRNKILGNGERVYEINYKPRFHDSSTVLNGAERVAKAFLIIDAPPENAIVSSFHKAIDQDKVAHYTSTDSDSFEKVAGSQTNYHPLLLDPIPEREFIKTASSPMLRKIAELEKELTGKILNVVTEPNPEKETEYGQMLEVIKFLTEKRMDDESLADLATTVKEVANENDVPISRAFTTLLGVAELMGIEFFPNELFILLKNMTDAKLSEHFHSPPKGEEPVYPGDYARKLNKAVITLQSPRTFEDPSSLVNLFDDVAHKPSEFLSSPNRFLSDFEESRYLDDHPPARMIRIIKSSLDPIIPMRSYHREHLIPRLSVVLQGHRPIIGGADVRRDIEMLANPSSLGDLLGGLTYGMYENMRPGIRGSRLFKIAAETADGLSKTARKKDKVIEPVVESKIKPWKFVAVGLPAGYAFSSFQKSRRDNGRYLSDVENFIADNSSMTAGVAGLAGGVGASKAKQISKAIRKPFTKVSSEEIESMVKEAESFPTGRFNIFQDDEVLKKYASVTGADPEEAAAVKMALLLSMGGMHKEAKTIMNHYNIPAQEKGRLLKIAAYKMDHEMEKAAEDFTNNMIMSVVGDTSPLGRSLPGRALDSFIFKKLGEIGEDDEKKKLKSKPDIEGPTNISWTESYRQGPALQVQSRGGEN